MSETVKITYRVMIAYAPGTMSGPSTLTDHDGKPLPPYDMGALGAHPFTQGQPNLSEMQGYLGQARAFADSRAPGAADVWIERVTEITRTERLT